MKKLLAATLAVLVLAVIWWVAREGSEVAPAATQDPIANLSSDAVAEATPPPALKHEQPELLAPARVAEAGRGVAPSEALQEDVPPRGVLRITALQEIDGVRQPVEGAVLMLSRIPLDGEVVPVPGAKFSRTDAQGVVDLELEPGSYVVAAKIDQALSKMSEVAVIEGRTLDHELLLLRTGTMVGVVLDALTLAPIAGAQVSARGNSRSDAAISDAAGRYEHARIALSDSYSSVTAGADGYGEEMIYMRIQESGAWSRDLRGDGSPSLSGTQLPARIDFQLVRDVVYTGRVLDERGQPIAGARVLGEGYLMVLIGGGPETASGIGAPDDSEAITGADGRFELRGMRGDIRHAVMIEAEGFALRSLTPRTEQGHVEIGDIVLRPEVRLHVTVEDSSGRAAEGMRLHLRASRDWLREPGDTPLAEQPASAREYDTWLHHSFERSALIDAQGRASLSGLTQSTVKIAAFWGPHRSSAAWPPPYSKAEMEVEIPPGVREHFVTLRLPESHRLLTGRVVAPESEQLAVSGLEVQLSRISRELGQVRTDEQGRFAFVGLIANVDVQLKVMSTTPAGVSYHASLETSVDEPGEALLLLQPTKVEPESR